MQHPKNEDSVIVKLVKDHMIVSNESPNAASYVVTFDTQTWICSEFIELIIELSPVHIALVLTPEPTRTPQDCPNVSLSTYREVELT